LETGFLLTRRETRFPKQKPGFGRCWFRLMLPCRYAIRVIFRAFPPFRRFVMKYLVLAVLLAALVPLGLMADKKPAPPIPVQQQQQQQVIDPNPNIDMDAYVKSVKEVAEHRKTRRLSEEDFIAMSKEEGVIVLDARSKDKFALMHIQGAINLSFPDITIASLKKTLPDKEAKILIYCNNNFKNAEVPFPSKAKIASLNISTYIALYNYGYKNVYELAPTVDPKTSKLAFVTK
jgi:hypothetical protein